MRVTPSIRAVCCLPLLVAALANPAMAALQLDSGTGLQASKEVSTPPPAKNQSAAVRRSRKSEAQALRAGVGAPANNRDTRTAPP